MRTSLISDIDHEIDPKKLLFTFEILLWITCITGN